MLHYDFRNLQIPIVVLGFRAKPHPPTLACFSVHQLLFLGLLYRDVKVSRPTWSRDHFFGLGLGLGLTVIGLGLGLGFMR